MSKTPTQQTEASELRQAVAVNMGLYFRKSDGKWLREKYDMGRYLGVEDMTLELNSVMELFAAQKAALLAEVEAAKQDRIHTNGSLCGCPMCDYHGEAYILTNGGKSSVEQASGKDK